MAYIRGQYYLWSDSDDTLHIWVADGDEGWDQVNWAHDEEGVKLGNASRVSLPEEVMDQYVLMRMAELIQEGKVAETIDRCLGPQGQRGNFGAIVLQHNAQKLKEALSQIKLEEPEAQ